MFIFADNSHIILECEYCGLKTQVPVTARKQRTFMTHFNQFKRGHEWSCGIKKDKQNKIANAEKTAADILNKLMVGQ